MNRSTTSEQALRAAAGFCASALFAVAAATAQVALTGDTGIDASGDYQQERAWCMANTAGEERVTCLKNSGAAQAEKRRGTLDTNGRDFETNALQRCDVFLSEERAACEARVAGYGSASGSVIGGGVIKQVETVVLPSGQRSVIIEPKTAHPVLLAPGQGPQVIR